jgi:hypothetical protein
MEEKPLLLTQKVEGSSFPSVLDEANSWAVPLTNTWNARMSFKRKLWDGQISLKTEQVEIEVKSVIQMTYLPRWRVYGRKNRELGWVCKTLSSGKMTLQKGMPRGEDSSSYPDAMPKYSTLSLPPKPHSVGSLFSQAQQIS